MSGAAVRAVVAAVWVALAAGPALGGLALVRAGQAADPSQQPAHPPPGVMGFAEAAVVSHLLTDPADVPSRLRVAQPALRSAGGARRPAAAATRVLQAGPRHAAAVAAAPAGPGRWGVEVLVVDRAGGVEAWQATVAETPDGPVLESLPTLVPTTPPTPGLRVGIGQLRVPDRDSPVTASVEGVVRALLLGEGDLDRYVDPSLRLQAAGVPELSAATLLRLGGMAVDPSVVGGTQTVATLAEVEVSRPDGRRHVMHLPLLLGQREGRWELLRLLPALPLAPGASQGTGPSRGPGSPPGQP